MFIRRLFFILLLVIPTSGFAFDANGIGESVVEGWSSWMRKHNVPAGALVVAYEGEVVATGEINRSVDDPAKVASLSKANYWRASRSGSVPKGHNNDPRNS